MYALCADAWFQAAKRKVSKSDSGDMPTEEDDPDSVVVEYVDFIKVKTLFLHLLIKKSCHFHG
jgi:peroxin-6